MDVVKQKRFHRTFFRQIIEYNSFKDVGIFLLRFWAPNFERVDKNKKKKWNRLTFKESDKQQSLKKDNKNKTFRLAVIEKTPIKSL